MVSLLSFFCCAISLVSSHAAHACARAALTPDAWGFGAGCVPLRNGCLVVMGGECQRTHKHELMKPTKALGESSGRRINLTLRHFAASAALASRKRQRQGEPAPEVASPPPLPEHAPAAPSPAHGSRGGGAWTCAACTYTHAGDEAAFLCCKVCLTQRESGSGSASSAATR